MDTRKKQSPNWIHEYEKEQNTPTGTTKAQANNNKWITFKFYGPRIRKITNIFRHTNLTVSFKTNNSLLNVLNTRQHKDNNIYAHSGIYEMVCQTCNRAYVGQTDRKLEKRYKEHTRYIKSNNEQLAFATHILCNRHEFWPIDKSMRMLYQASKGKRMNVLEN
jgi:hypothetical protein